MFVRGLKVNSLWFSLSNSTKPGHFIVSDSKIEIPTIESGLFLNDLLVVCVWFSFFQQKQKKKKITLNGNKDNEELMIYHFYQPRPLLLFHF